jgi:CHASE3 domain sensor protein
MKIFDWMPVLKKMNFISFSILIASTLIVLGAGFSLYNHRMMTRALEVSNQSAVIKKETERFYQNVWKMDISLRGFALTKEDRFLFLKHRECDSINRQNISTLDSLLLQQGYSNLEAYTALKQAIQGYIDLYGRMEKMVREDQMDEFNTLLKQDQGFAIWKHYEKFSTELFAYEDQLNEQAEASYKGAVWQNTILQGLLLLIGLPIMLLLSYRLKQESRMRKALVVNLNENNYKYLFHPGKSVEEEGEERILAKSIENLRSAADFVSQIAEGNYQVDWKELNAENRHLNESNLVGRLILMREEMKKVKVEDQRRLWATDGLNQFSSLIRNHQHNLEELTLKVVAFLVRYMHAQQGSLFVVKQEEGVQTRLELAACYAFDRRKFVEKTIAIGQGLIGQAYLEKEVTLLKEIPNGYTAITSGLGDATPRCLLIVPMMYNDQVEAILELATFQAYEPHEIAFIEKAGEFVASAIATAQINERTRQLLEEFTMQAEMMRAQEEEMRQNMEELAATQEEMRRKEQMYVDRIAELEKQ